MKSLESGNSRVYCYKMMMTTTKKKSQTTAMAWKVMTTPTTTMAAMTMTTQRTLPPTTAMMMAARTMAMRMIMAMSMIPNKKRKTMMLPQVVGVVRMGRRAVLNARISPPSFMPSKADHETLKPSTIILPPLGRKFEYSEVVDLSRVWLSCRFLKISCGESVVS